MDEIERWDWLIKIFDFEDFKRINFFFYRNSTLGKFFIGIVECW